MTHLPIFSDGSTSSVRNLYHSNPHLSTRMRCLQSMDRTGGNRYASWSKAKLHAALISGRRCMAHLTAHCQAQKIEVGLLSITRPFDLRRPIAFLPAGPGKCSGHSALPQSVFRSGIRGTFVSSGLPAAAYESEPSNGLSAPPRRRIAPRPRG